MLQPQQTVQLFLAFMVLTALAAAGSTLVALVTAAVPLVLVLGGLWIVARLVTYYTRRDR